MSKEFLKDVEAWARVMRRRQLAAAFTSAKEHTELADEWAAMAKLAKLLYWITDTDGPLIKDARALGERHVRLAIEDLAFIVGTV